MNEIFYHLEVAVEKVFVEAGGEGFEVDVHGVYVRGDFVQYFERCGAVCYEDILKTSLFGEFCSIADKLITDERLVVGKS